MRDLSVWLLLHTAPERETTFFHYLMKYSKAANVLGFMGCIFFNGGTYCNIFQFSTSIDPVTISGPFTLPYPYPCQGILPTQDSHLCNNTKDKNPTIYNQSQDKPTNTRRYLHVCTI